MTTTIARQSLNTKNSIYDDKYELNSSIGRGRGSVVYKAHRISENGQTEQPIALKILTGTEKNPREAQKRIQKEARALTSLNHINIIKAFNYVARADCCYLSMEYAEYGDLAKVLANSTDKINPKTALKITKAILHGLEHIHANNIIHRDLKLENILVTKDFIIKVSDFSAALLEGERRELNLVNTFAGTLEYVAPECLQGKPYSEQSDIYSVGVILYKLITGAFPFECESIHQSMMLKKAGILNKVEFNFPNNFRGLDSVLQKFLSPNPEDRFQSALDAIKAITALQEGTNQISRHEDSKNSYKSPKELSIPSGENKKKLGAFKYFKWNIILSSFLLMLLGINYSPNKYLSSHNQTNIAEELGIRLEHNSSTGILRNLNHQNQNYSFSLLPYDETHALFNLSIQSWQSIPIDISSLKKGEPLIIKGQDLNLVLTVTNKNSDLIYQGKFRNLISGSTGTWEMKL